MENYLEIKCSASSRVLFMDFYSGKSSYYWQPMEEMYCCDRLVLYVQKLWRLWTIYSWIVEYEIWLFGVQWAMPWIFFLLGKVGFVEYDIWFVWSSMGYATKSFGFILMLEVLRVAKGLSLI